MSDLKPIEPGCLCVIIKSFCGHTGKVLTVGGRIPQPISFAPGKYWSTDTPLRTTWGREQSHVCETHIMRIDGHEPDEQSIVERELITTSSSD